MDKNIGRLNVELTGDSSKLVTAANGAMDKLRQVKDQLMGVGGTGFEQVKSQVEALTPSMQRFKGLLETMSAKRLQGEFETLSAKISETQAKTDMIKADMQKATYWEYLLALQKQLEGLQPVSSELTAKLDMVKQKLDEINGKNIERVTNGLKGATSDASRFGNEFSKSMDAGMRKLKKLAVSLIGLRTVWTLLTRAARDYLSRDKEMATQMQSMIAALGQALAPMTVLVVQGMQYMVKWLLVIIAYITSFINVVFGMNLAITKNIKQMKKWADASNDAKSSLAGFDDIQILTQPAANTSDLATDFKFYDISAELAPLAEFNKYLTENKDMIIAITYAFAGMAAALILVNIAMGIFAIMTGAVSGVVIGIAILIALVIYMAYNWESGAKTLMTWLTWLWEGFIVVCKFIFDIVATTFSLIFAGPIQAIKMFIGIFINMFMMFVNVFNGIIKAISDVLTGLFTGITQMITGYVDIWVNIFKGIVTFFTGVFTGDWKKAWKGISDIFMSVWNGIMKMFNGGGTIFGGIVDGISGIFKTIINGLISGINIILSSPLNFLNGILNTIRAISIMGIKPFAGLWGQNPVPIPQIPKLATGAVATGPTVAQIGEGRYSEAVIPLGQSPQFADMKKDIANMVVAAVGASGGSQNIEVTVKIKEETLAKYAISGINKMQRQAGRTLLEV